MARDYAKRNWQRKKSKKKKSALVPWLLVLLLFVALVFVLLYLGKQKQQSPMKPVVTKTTKEVGDKKKKAKASVTKTTITPKFDFYTIQPQASSGKDGEKYELDVSVVKSYGAADRLKAELALLGFTVGITPVRVNGNQKFQVSVGPYDSRGIATAALERLKHNKISSTLKKIR